MRQCYEKAYVIADKGMKIIHSCKTREHCVVAHNWLTLACKEIEDHRHGDQLIHTLNEAYLGKILRVTGVIE